LNLPFENVGINDARTDCGLLEANIDCKVMMEDVLVLEELEVLVGFVQ
jgi:hypothetical protein